MAKEFIGRTPEIQSEAPVIELAKLFDHSFAMLIEIDCPLTARKKVTEIGLQTFPARAAVSLPSCRGDRGEQGTNDCHRKCV